MLVLVPPRLPIPARIPARGLDWTDDRRDVVACTPRDAHERLFGEGSHLRASVPEQFDQHGIPIIELPTGRGVDPLSMVRALFSLYRFLRAGRYDIVQSHTAVGGVVGRLAGFAARVPHAVWTAHSYGSHPGLGPVAQRVILAIERGFERLTHHYIAVSEDMKLTGLRKRIFSEDKVTVIHNGIDLEELDEIARSRETVESPGTFGFPTEATVVGTVTRLEPQKAIDDFLEAAAVVARERPEVHFVIAGDGPLRGQLQDLAGRLGIANRVRFLGWRSDAFAVLSVFDVFCMSSLWEGCPMVLLEAMAASKPVVSTCVGGVGELVMDGETGLLVPPAQPRCLAEALLRLTASESLRRCYGEAGRRRVEEQFTLQSMVRAYERFYEELVAGEDAAPSSEVRGTTR